MATFTTYDQVGKKEDVSDIISDITPLDSPMFSLMKTEKVNARVFEWQEDALRAANPDNGIVEGADATIGTLTATTMRSNTTQILEESFQVSKTSDAIATYGRAKETAYQLGRALKAIKRDLEAAYVGRDQAAVSGSGSVARKMASVINQITTDENNATPTALTEAMVLSAGETAYDNGSDVNTLMIKPGDAQIVAGFAGSAGRNREIAQGKTLVNAIDLYVSPYGEYRVVLNRHLATDTALLIDPAMFKTCVLRPFARTLLAATGDSDKHSIVGEYSCKHMNFGDSVKITGLT